jgi:hypothetical protein
MKFLQRLLYKVCVSCRPNKSRTVRYAFPMVFTTILILSAAAITSNNSSYIKLTTTEKTVQIDDLFTINVLVGAKVAVNAIDIQINFPDDQIEIEGIDTGESVITMWTEEPYVRASTVYLSGGTFRKGFLGEHLIAQINARAKKNGNAKFTIDNARVLAGDGLGTQVSLSNDGIESLTLYVSLTEGLNEEILLEGEISVGIFTDINGDGKVDMNDIINFMSAWRSSTRIFDFNNDGRMTFTDFAIILSDSFFK